MYPAQNHTNYDVSTHIRVTMNGTHYSIHCTFQWNYFQLNLFILLSELGLCWSKITLKGHHVDEIFKIGCTKSCKNNIIGAASNENFIKMTTLPFQCIASFTYNVDCMPSWHQAITISRPIITVASGSLVIGWLMITKPVGVLYSISQPGDHYWDYYPGAPSLSEVTATHLMIGHL